MTTTKKDEVQRSIMRVIQIFSALGIFGLLFQMGQYREKIDNCVTGLKDLKISIDVNAQDNRTDHKEIWTKVMAIDKRK